MKIVPFDEDQPLESGDYIYRYVETAAFMLIEDTGVKTPDGDDVITWEGEMLNTVCVAVVAGTTFTVYWTPDTSVPIVRVPEAGFIMRNGIIADVLFPYMENYEYATTN